METSSALNTEFDFIKEQIHLYRSAIYQFVIINTQAQQPFSEYDIIQRPENDNLQSLIEALDTFGLETRIKIILMEKDAKNLSSFLKSSFIDPFNDQVEVLREAANFELSEYETASENKQLRLYITKQLYAVHEKINEIINNLNPAETNEPDENKQQLLSIVANAGKEQILNFWLKLQGKNEKDKPYWKSKEEITHFVHQNFSGFPGVSEIKTFEPNMSKTELYHVVWMFFNEYGLSNSKPLYVKLLINNFPQIIDTPSLYSNIKNYKYYKRHLMGVLE